MATIGVPPINTIPTSTQAHTVERLTMTGPNAMIYEMTYDDPEVFTAPWTARIEWTRDDKYEIYEYACHEGDVQVRNYINASRAARKQIAAGTRKAETLERNRAAASPRRSISIRSRRARLSRGQAEPSRERRIALDHVMRAAMSVMGGKRTLVESDEVHLQPDGSPHRNSLCVGP